MKHLLDVDKLSAANIFALINRAQVFKQQSNIPNYSDYTLATLFYEHSTRTRISFELAAKRLGMQVVNFDIQNSSESKGETIFDTLQTLNAMGIQLFAVRHGQNGLPWELAVNCSESSHIINAGDGTHAHPSQALLDLMTIIEKKPDIKNLKIAVIGDLRHSRVVGSLQRICAILNVGELRLIAPEIWQPEKIEYGEYTNSLDNGLKDADVVMCLRVQQERLLVSEGLDLELYRRHYGLTQERLAMLRKDVMIMHPGPINRGIEMDGFVADCAHSVILEQVKNGVFMRMAILEALSLA
jgi:aspartate carbamoyltransferase catalytic subunit